jgi:quercetin dioxygenase-like cupin family protein
VRTIVPQDLEWQREQGVGRAVVHNEKLGDQQVQVEMLEVEAGQTLRPHTHKKRREFLVVVHASGAQLRLGERVFRPTLGQTFEREPGEIMEIVNDAPNSFRILRFQLAFDAADTQNV